MRANAPLYSLNAGEVSKIALARVDVAKLRMAAQCQVNWLPYVMGPMMLRPGLFYVGEVLGDEVLPMLNAMSQGRSGSMCTIHADSSAGVFRRLASRFRQPCMPR